MNEKTKIVITPQKQQLKSNIASALKYIGYFIWITAIIAYSIISTYAFKFLRSMGLYSLAENIGGILFPYMIISSGVSGLLFVAASKVIGYLQGIKEQSYEITYIDLDNTEKVNDKEEG